MRISTEALNQALIALAIDAGRVANFCDHVEHNETTSIADVKEAALDLRELGVRLAAEAGSDPVELYRERLRHVEWRNVLHSDDSFDGPGTLPASPTWRDLQLVQSQHDRYYHPDVLGLTKLDQLRHFTLHVAKLCGAVADGMLDDAQCADLLARRVPDMLIFGTKLSTVVGEKLGSGLVVDSLRIQRVAAASSA